MTIGPTLADSQGNPVLINAGSINRGDTSDIEGNLTNALGSLEVSKAQLETLQGSLLQPSLGGLN